MQEGIFSGKDLLENSALGKKDILLYIIKVVLDFSYFLLNFKNETHFITPFFILLISLLLTANWPILPKEIY